MSFRDPHQHQHKIDGMKRAASSPHTPAHLRPHLHKRIQEHTAMLNASTEAGRHAKGASISNVKPPQKKSQTQTSGQSPKTAAYSDMHPTRAAELLTTSNTSADAQKQISAPPAPFKSQFSVAQSAPAATSPNGSAAYVTSGIAGRPERGSVESKAGPVSGAPIPKAHAPSGGMNQKNFKPGISASTQGMGRRTPKKSLFFGE